jgi:hypothetical protein
MDQLAGPGSDDTAAYVVTPIPHWVRLLKAAIPTAVGVSFAGLSWTALYQAGKLFPDGLIGVLVLVAMLVIAKKLYGETEKDRPAAICTPIPLAARREKSLIAALVTLALCVIAWLFQYRSDQLQQYWWNVWPVALAGFLWSAWLLLAAKRTALTPAARAAIERRENEKRAAKQANQKQLDHFFARWWVRYPLAGLVLWGAYLMYQDRPNKWMLPLAAVVAAMLMAKELSLLILGVAAVVLLFKGIAALPVSVAIIAGAIIIASALKK